MRTLNEIMELFQELENYIDDVKITGWLRPSEKEKVRNMMREKALALKGTILMFAELEQGKEHNK
jgi:hypothetical protein